MCRLHDIEPEFTVAGCVTVEFLQKRLVLQKADRVLNEPETWLEIRHHIPDDAERAPGEQC